MKAIAIIEILEDGKGKWYIDGLIRYTEDESLMKKFDADMIPLKPMPKKKIPNGSDIFNDYVRGYNECIDDLNGETE